MIINCTPHVVDIYGVGAPNTITAGGPDPYRSLPPSGDVARLVENVANDGEPAPSASAAESVDIFVVEYGHVSGLPDPRAGVWYVVSLPVALALRARADLLVPYRQVRNERGTVVGCRGFARPC